MNSPRSLTAVALATQAVLGGAGLIGAALAGVSVPPLFGRPVRDLAVGGVVAAALGGLNFFLLHRPRGMWRSVRAAVDDVLVPTFAGLTPQQVVVVSLAAGIGEELFFRGCLQPAIGLIPASVAFGLAHVAGARMLAFGVWAIGMGLVLGALVVATDGLLASITAHACYDVLAFHYLGAEGRRRAIQGV